MHIISQVSIMIYGEKIALRAIDKEDLPQLLKWRNNPEYRKFFREYRELNLQNQESWFDNTVNQSNNTIMFSIVLNNESQELIGCCGLCYINWIQRNSDLSLYIGKDNLYIDSDGYAEEACKLLFNYGFGELGLHKIWTEIYEFDTQKLELYNKLGFHKDGILRDNYFHNNTWYNSFYLSLISTDYDL